MTSLERLWGAGDVDAVFRGGDRSVVPWPRVGRVKGSAPPDPRIVELLGGPVHLTEVDPLELHASQAYVVRHHAVHYALTDLWEATGRTSADMGQRANRFPIIAPDHVGRLVIRSGHHRSLAALLAGRPVLARLVGADSCGTISVTPRVPLDDEAVVRLQALGLDEEQIVDRLHVARGGRPLLAR